MKRSGRQISGVSVKIIVELFRCVGSLFDSEDFQGVGFQRDHGPVREPMDFERE